MKKYKILFAVPLFFCCAFQLLPEDLVVFKDRKDPGKEVYNGLRFYKAIFFGEIHGTNEVPELLGGISNVFLKNGQHVLLGLEIDKNYQPEIDNFLLTRNDE